MSHPYFPKDLELQGFIPSAYSRMDILAPFGFAVAVTLLFGSLVIAPKSHSLSTWSVGTKLVFLWFLVSGIIHIVLEGYFVSHAATLPSRTDWISSLWKEYAISDSRYMTYDLTVLVIEGIAAFVCGPLCLCTAWLIYHDSSKRHLFQFFVSLVQFDGLILYYLTSILDGSKDCDPSPLYYYGYFLGANHFWLVIPALIMMRSGSYIIFGLAMLQGAQPKKSQKAKSVRIADHDEEEPVVIRRTATSVQPEALAAVIAESISLQSPRSGLRSSPRRK